MKNEREILADPSTSTWLKEQIEASKGRDVIDAINDAETLVTILETRFNALLVAHGTDLKNRRSQS